MSKTNPEIKHLFFQAFFLSTRLKMNRAMIQVKGRTKKASILDRMKNMPDQSVKIRAFLYSSALGQKFTFVHKINFF